MSDDYSDALEELEDVFLETIEWAGKTYPVIASGAKVSSSLGAGGFAVDNDFTLALRANLFDADLPQPHQTFKFTRYREDGRPILSAIYAISEIHPLPGGIIRIVAVDSTKGV